MIKKDKTVKRTNKVEKIQSDDIKDAIMKKALGYQVQEVTEEYTMVENELVVTKKKINTKLCPPDLEAIQLALQDKTSVEDNLASLTDEELIEREEKLITLLKNIKKET